MNKTSVCYNTVVTFILSLVKVVLYTIVAITTLATIGVNAASLITAVAAGLALRDSLSNLASGMIILLNKPFVAGDLLEFEGVKGRVESIKIFYNNSYA